MSYNTNFIVNVNGQNTDLGTLLYKWNTNVINIPSTGTTLGSYSINYTSPTIIRESDISVAMDGTPLNGDQVYTFGPAVQNRTVLVDRGGTNRISFSNDGIVFNGLGSTQQSNTTVWDGIKWVAIDGTLNVSISYNGINWQDVATLTSVSGGNNMRMLYNGKMYVVHFNLAGYNIAYSYDGIIWNSSKAPINYAQSLGWNGSNWLLSGSGVNSFATSSDGINWTGLGAFANAAGICWNGNYWVAIGPSFIAINKNPSGQGTWQTVDSSIFTNTGVANYIFCQTIAWNGKIMIATGNAIATGVGNTFAYSSDGINWKSQGFIIYQDTLVSGRSIWNGRVFINTYGSAITANSLANSLATSYDGINWQGKGTSVRGMDIAFNARRQHSVTFQRNMTIIFGGTTTNGNIMAYSLDGINYRACNANFHNVYNYFYYTPHGIDYNGKVWVTVSYNNNGNTIAASRDGINWYGLGLNLAVYQNCGIFWLGNRWFSGAGSTYSYSYDGFTWIPVYKPEISTDWRTFAYNGSIYVAGGYGPYTLAYSYDGINWTGVINSNTTFGSVWHIVTNGKIFICCGWGVNNNNFMGYSYDGINWTVNPTTIGLNYSTGIATNGTMFVATGNVPNIGLVGYSYDGINWYAGSASGIWNSGQARPSSVTWNGTMWVMVGASTNTNGIAYSYNGINWTLSPTTNNNILTGNAFIVASNYGVAPMPFIQHPTLAFGSGQNTIAYSPDGISWTGLGNTVFSTAGYCGFWSGSFWVAGGQGGNTLAYSYDGIQWSGIKNNVLFASVQGITYNGVIWVATGTAATGGNSAAYSSDGLNWTGLTISGLTSGSSVYWNGTVFMLISNVSGLAYHSSNGQVWTQSTSSTLNGMPASNGLSWVICTRNNSNSSLYYVNAPNPVTSSYTAITPNLFTTSGNCVCYGGFIWVAGGVGTGNTLAYSYNGTNWTGLGTTAFPNGCSSICWNGTRYVGGGTTYIGYSPDGIKWYTGQTGLFTNINYVVSNPGIGAFVPPSAMVLNNNGISGNGISASQTLEIVSSDPYFQSGFTNVSFNITSNNIYSR